jgi:hypothetical protein
VIAIRKTTLYYDKNLIDIFLKGSKGYFFALRTSGKSHSGNNFVRGGLKLNTSFNL